MEIENKFVVIFVLQENNPRNRRLITKSKGNNSSAKPTDKTLVKLTKIKG